MIQFKPIGIEDRKLITSYIIPSENRDNTLSIVNLCSWHFLNESSYAIIDNHLILRFRFGRKFVYSMPIGSPEVALALDTIHRESKERDQPLYLLGVFPALKEQLEKYFSTPFEYQLSRDHFDYLYLREDLAELKGKNYQAKRNHVNKFKKQYDFRYTPLTAEMIPLCLELHDKWCISHDCDQHESLTNEQEALNFALLHFDSLGLLGGAVWVNDEMVAFAYGAPVNHDTFAVHIEKADTNIHGVYPVINQEFAKHIPPHYIYLNREEDLGLPGLRKSKLSYYPAILLEKCMAVLPFA